VLNEYSSAFSYTLAVGKAPFHAPKREDIYKKLQNRDYKWPDVSKCQNDISKDLEDLVGSLLVHEDDRPSPDQIVSHAFFKTAFVPDQLDSATTQEAPRWSNVRPPTAEVLRQGFSDSWFNLCRESGVGEYAPGRMFQLPGGKRIRSVVRDCEKELAAGRHPTVPIPQDTVYLPFPERASFMSSGPSTIVEIKEESDTSGESRCLNETSGNGKARAPPRRLADKARTTKRLKENTEPIEETQEESPRKTEVRKLSRKASQQVIGVSASERPKGKPLPETRTMTRPMSRTTSDSTTATMKRSRQVAEDIEIARPSEYATTRGAAIVETSRHIPQAKGTPIPMTDPATVLARVSRLRDNLAEALAKKDRPVSRRTPRSHQLPFVSKWVDYSRKHGLGYVLNDGSIGCLVNATSRHPVTFLTVQDGYYHLQNIGQDPKSIAETPMKYYADFGPSGIRSTTVDKERRRTTGVLWAKFGKYMCQQLGQAEARFCADSTSEAPSTFVRFYQRTGSVGIWGFSDGCFQVSWIFRLSRN